MGPPYHSLLVWRFAENAFWRQFDGTYVHEDNERDQVEIITKRIERHIRFHRRKAGTISGSKPAEPHFRFELSKAGDRVRITFDSGDCVIS